MPKPIFIDTGAFLALEDESDEHHDEALEFRDGVLAEGNYSLISTSYVLDEALTLVRVRIGIRPSVKFCQRIRASKVVDFISVSSDMENSALDLFENYDDKDFSFTDCVSFVLMQEMGIREVFGFDHHFEQMGFRPRPPQD